jgi:hypothetical protein
MLARAFPDGNVPMTRAVEAYVRLARTHREILSPWNMIESLDRAKPVWNLDEPVRERRLYLDRLQVALTSAPDRWYLWIGLAWGLRWSGNAEVVHAAFLRGIEVYPQCPWGWCELAAWEQYNCEEGSEANLRKSRAELRADALRHAGIARGLLKARAGLAVQEAVTWLDGILRPSRGSPGMTR